MDLKQAAAFLHIHPVTLSRLAKAGKVPAAKPGKKWVFIEEDLLAWLRSQYKKPINDAPAMHEVSKDMSKDGKYKDMLSKNSSRKSNATK